MATAAGIPESPKGPRLLLVDGHAYAYRAFYAIRSLTAPDGRPTNAVFGFIKMLDRLRSWVQPSHIAVVWDGGLAAERLAALPGYKAQRPPMPEALAAQIDELAAWFEAAEIVSCQHDGVEADDWIAALAVRASAADWDTVIASSDKDFMQLVSNRVRLVNPNDKAERLWGRAEVRAKAGVEPDQIVDWLSLVGDSVDNIPGVPGVGEKTAATLLEKFGSVGAILAGISSVTPERIRDSIAATEQDLRRNQHLIRLKADLDPELGPELSSLAVRPGRLDRMVELCGAWGFRSMQRELERRAEEPALLL